MCLPPLSAPTGVKCCSQDPIFKKLAQTQSYISLRSKSVFPPHSSQLFSIVLLYGCTASRYQFAWLLFNYPEINRHLCKLSFEKTKLFWQFLSSPDTSCRWDKNTRITVPLCKLGGENNFYQRIVKNISVKFSTIKRFIVALSSKCNSWRKLALSVEKVIWNLEQR